MTAASPLLHLVLGDHAAAVLRLALKHHALPGDIRCIPDDLGHGPLDNGIARVAYMRRRFEGGFDWTHTATDAFDAWRTLEQTLRAYRADLVVWRGSNVSETILLMMACSWLRDADCRISVVELPDTPTLHTHVGTRMPDDLAGYFPIARSLSPTERAANADAFEKLKAEPDHRRQWKDGRVVAVPISAFDDLLVRAYSQDWQNAARVVGRAMGEADPRDALADVFLSSRLQALIAAGRLEPDSPPRLLRDYRIRLTA